MACKLSVYNPIITIILIKPDKEIKFVFDNKSTKDFIYLDDTLNIIKKKIFKFISNPSKDYYIRENNQQIWTQPSPGSYKVLDFHYIDKQTDSIIPIIPAIYDSTKPDPNFVDDNGVKQSLYRYINQNNMILYDLIDLTNKHELTLYVCNLDDIKLDQTNTSIIYGFINKHFPQSELKKEINNKLDYKIIGEQIEREKVINDFLDNVDIDEKQIKDCKINHFFLDVNYNDIDKYIDLMKIFNYLREHLSIDIPFIKYKEPDWEQPYSSLYKPMIDDKIINEKILIEKWLYNIKKDRVSGKLIPLKELAKGIIIRIKTHEHHGLPQYGIIQIYNTGKLSYIVNFEEGYDADISDVERCINNLHQLIDNINKIDYRIDKTIQKYIQPPEIFKHNKNIILSSNASFRYIKSDARFNINRPIDYTELYNLSKLFTNYVSKRSSETNDKKFIVNYNRLSNFKNISYIISFINEQMQYGKSEYDIIIEIMEQFNKSKEEANELINEYMRTLGQQFYRTSSTTIEINGQTNFLKINGSTSIFQLIRATQFTIAFITLYENLSKYKKMKDYKDIFSLKQIIKKEETEEEEIKVDELSDLDYNGVANIDYDINVDKYLQNIDFVPKSNQSNQSNQSEYESPSYELAPNSEIDLNIKLKCDDPIPELDTCKDLCNDRSYYLRRLQRHDPKLFRYKLSQMKDKTYASICQGTDDRQPIVMKTDPAKHPLIDRDSYTYSIKYGSTKDNMNYYICPKSWCPYHQIPIKYNKIKDIQVRQTIEGPCTVGKCPFGDHEVMINTKSLFSNPKFNDKGLNPGFSKNKHPDGYCLPCCFANPQNEKSSSTFNEFMKCLGEDSENIKKDESVRYILGYNNILSENRFGLLPVLVSKILGNPPSIEPGFIKKSGYYRKGVKQIKNKSLFAAISECVSDNKDDPITIDMLIEHLVKSLTPELFKSLNNGVLEILFKSNDSPAIDVFKDYIRNNSVSELYLWDLLSKPGILYPEGTNIIIFTEKNIICPIGLIDSYSPDKKTIMLIKIMDYIEPIYHLEYLNNKIKLTWVFDSDTPIIKYIFNIIKTNCTEKPALNWEQLFKNNDIKYPNIDLNLKETIQLLDNNNLSITQIVDDYNKVIGLLLDDKAYIPIKPSGINTDYKTIHVDDVSLISFTDMLKILKLLSKKKLYTQPIAKVLSGNNDNIIAGIQIETGTIIPIKPINITNIHTDLPYSDEYYYEDVDKKIHDMNITPDEQIIRVNKIKFEMESYERFRFEISKYLQKHKTLLDEIKHIINIKSISSDKKKKLLPIITHLINTLTTTSRKNKNFIDNYQTPNIRTSCFNSTKCDGLHCISDGKKCKLYINKYNLINNKDNISLYKLKIIEELIRNKIKRDEILFDNVPEILNKDQMTEQKNEISFFDKPEQIIDKVKKLYAIEQQIHLENIDTFDITDEKFYGIDKNTIKKYSNIEEQFVIEPLSIHWSELFGNDFKIDHTNSFFISLIKVLNASKNSINANKYNITRVKEDILKFEPNRDFLTMKGLSENSSIVDLYKLYYPSIETFSQLEKYITDDYYNGNIIDIEIAAEIYHLTFIIVDKRQVSENPNGLRIITGTNEFEKEGFVFLYYSNRKDKEIYDILIKKQQLRFTWDEIPTKIQELLTPLMILPIKPNKNTPKKMRIKIKKQ